MLSRLPHSSPSSALRYCHPVTLSSPKLQRPLAKCANFLPRQLPSTACLGACKTFHAQQHLPPPATPPTDDPVVALHRSGIFKQCTDLLASVQKALDSFVEVDRQRIANLTKRLAWPLREKEVTDALQRLARLRGIISTAIEARSVYVVPRKGRFDQANIKLTPLYKCTAERSCASKPHKRSWLIWSRV